MTKFEWFSRFDSACADLSTEDRTRANDYYRELFDDKLEAGEREEDILQDFGTPESAAERLKSETETSAEPAAPTGGYSPAGGQYAPQSGYDPYASYPPAGGAGTGSGMGTGSGGQSVPPTGRSNPFASYTPPTGGAGSGTGMGSGTGAGSPYSSYTPAGGGTGSGTGSGAGTAHRRKMPWWAILLIVIGVLSLIFGAIGAIGSISHIPHSPNREKELSATVNEIRIEADAGQITVGKTDKAFPVLRYYESNRIDVSVDETGAAVHVVQKVKSFFLGRSGEIEILLPNGSADTLDVHLDAGKISVKDVSVREADLNVSAGQLKIDALDVQNTAVLKVEAGQITGKGLSAQDLTMRIDAGEIDVQLKGAKTDYSIDAQVQVGSGSLSQPISAEKTIKAYVDAGSISLSFDR